MEKVTNEGKFVQRMANRLMMLSGGGRRLESSLKFRGRGCLGGGEIDQANLNFKERKEGGKVN